MVSPLAVMSSPADLISPRWWLQYVLEQYDKDPYHTTVETLLIVFIVYLIVQKPSNQTKEALSTKDQDAIIAEWEPEPLCAASENDDYEEPWIVSSGTGPRVTVNGNAGVLNLASTNFLGFANSPDVKADCAETITKYGVGSCGPRGFYGTIDKHLEFEKTLAEFCETEEAILYSDGIACVSSVIPAFAKRGDDIVCDEAANFGIQQGVRLSRSNVVYFKHNDMADLERTLESMDEKRAASSSSKALNRRFIIVEGISQYNGDVCDMKRVVELARRFKHRVILDDSLALGTLGPTGRGSLEEAGLKITDVEIFAANVDAALGTVGGFCTGSNQVVRHQRLSGAGYCFSASSPPYTASAGTFNTKRLIATPALPQTVQARAEQFRGLLKGLPGLTLVGGVCKSPLLHLRFSRPLSPANLKAEYKTETAALRAVRDKLLEDGIATEVPVYVPAERQRPRPSLKLMVSAEHTKEDLQTAARKIAAAFEMAPLWIQ